MHKHLLLMMPILLGGCAGPPREEDHHPVEHRETESAVPDAASISVENSDGEELEGSAQFD